ncbi:hypothetical protein I7I50_08938 [Histoplasma capsulatum G186AR]|uniref:Uncharacterized protein n=1 Tax=Ajellomyces capsulatus TaxID=5037 RepID=A0A8H7YTS4_AJECA|nr:hypothetical protein I7I52_06454 [Histoplasma capsulatum]QSS73975.1 hypothetical protein I7I50_08938 [Histoplasma capsulatum G186AR]
MRAHNIQHIHTFSCGKLSFSPRCCIPFLVNCFALIFLLCFSVPLFVRCSISYGDCINVGTAGSISVRSTQDRSSNCVRWRSHTSGAFFLRFLLFFFFFFSHGNLLNSWKKKNVG